MKRVLLLATTTGYQTRMFSEAAALLGVELIYATDRCDQLDDPWRDGAIAVRFHEEWRSVDTVLKALDTRPIDAVLALGDRPTVMAAYLSRLLGLPAHPAEAAAAARDKRLSRAKLKVAGLPTPAFITVPVGADPLTLLSELTFPVVVKPTVLSGSRGVIRADDAMSFATAFDRVRRLLASPEVRELRDPAADVIQIEEYVPGSEYALEGILDNGTLRTLAIFDKPDPLDGPFFEETIYVTPSRATPAIQRQIEASVAAAITALGLHHGPIHAECRVNADGVFVLEVAARPIGGLCAKSLRFVNQALEPSSPRALQASSSQNQHSIGFEEFLLRHALGEQQLAWTRESSASAVMMIPIPRSGVYRRVDGVEEASGVPNVYEVQITAKPDQKLLVLPEGASYLGFIFARAPEPAAAEGAVREAHARLRFTIEPLLTIVNVQ
ncbi:MAG: ATP-grasp domain-containing protein [Vicinamibacterales bacterium]